MYNVQMSKIITDNPLGHESIGKLIFKFATPSVFTNILGALYNLFDQVFSGHAIGYDAIAAIGITFPFVTIVTAISAMLGFGVSTNFSLSLGAKRREEAEQITINGLSAMAISGIAMAVLFSVFLRPMLFFFGATEEIIELSMDYMSIVVLATPFQILNVGLTTLIRADGSPNWSMICMLAGAVLNLLLDSIFIFVLGMGIRGAALGTAIGQAFSAMLATSYLLRGMKSIYLPKRLVIPKWKYLKKICSLGAVSFTNQIALTAVQIVLNSVLRHYGELSVYGATVVLGAVGSISRINIIFISFVIGVGQGSQPIFGYNYGAKNFSRVKDTLKAALIINMCIAVSFFALFQLFPNQLVGLFGEGTPEYFRFATRYLQVYMFMTFLNGIQPLAAGYFTAVGKAKMGIFISFTRQIVFLLPLLIFIPMFLGIDGVVIAGPIADSVAAIISSTLLIKEIRKLGKLDAEEKLLRK